ncbi:hypothetical protein B0T25DRAFT_134459 [Lasiosphaeria hispida]|uniref:BZIP domain-containing protein n=1 Tax=Lasiosphaeria hispida TaxID=260671 RepID=A0AAJ0HKM5_9PEZI|nr:hypothetical protein B0T25DRAFT_134459 [Lasiosphaeria hispida]
MEQIWLPHIRSPSDSWVGVTETDKRRRLQNRLAQRARRAKKKAKEKSPDSGDSANASSQLRRKNQDNTVEVVPRVPHEPRLTHSTYLVGSLDWSFIGPPTPSSAPPQLAISGSTILQGDIFQGDLLSIPYPPEWNNNNRNCPVRATLDGSPLPVEQDLPPRPNTSIPITLTLKRMHVSAAFWRNADALGLTCGPPAALDTNTNTSPSSSSSSSSSSALMTTLPASLRPTSLQSTVLHMPLIDCLPFSTMRDRIISAAAVVDLDLLREDLLSMGFSCWGRRPWDPRGWEIPAAFIEKWWWLLDEEIVTMTNFWREERADIPLVWRGSNSDMPFVLGNLCF